MAIALAIVLLVGAGAIAPRAHSQTAAVTVPGGGGFGATYDSAKGEVFVTNSRAVAVISDSSNAVVAQVPLAGEPYGIAYDPAKGEVFVANAYTNSVDVISDASNTVIAAVGVGLDPQGIAYDSVQGEVFMTDTMDSFAYVMSDAISATSTTSTVPEFQIGLLGVVTFTAMALAATLARKSIGSRNP